MEAGNAQTTGLYKQKEGNMKRTILFKAAVCIVFAALLLAMNYVLFTVYAAYRIGMTPVYLAARDLPPRTRIGEEDLIETEIPAGYILPGTVTAKEQIIGMITDIQGTIPAGSPFYASMLEKPEEIWDYGVSLLKEGQTACRLLLDPAELRTLSAGMRADVHIVIEQKDLAPLTGCILSHARILVLRDRQGIPVDDPESSGVPYLAEIAVNREDIDLLAVAESEGTLRLYASEGTYRGMEAARPENSAALRYLLSRMEKAGPQGSAQGS